MIKVLIIEDEKSAFENLKRILALMPQEIEIVAWLQSVEQGHEWFNSNEMPDLIFLDIQLSDDLSFKLFEDRQIDVPIVFTTAYDEFAIQAFELNSIAYILKPIEKEKIEQALNKFETQEIKRDIPMQAVLEKLSGLRPKDAVKERFLVHKGDELIVIRTAEIAYFYRSDATYLVHENGEHYAIKYSLEQLEKLLDANHFYRINRQMISSIHAIAKISLWFNGKLKIELTPKFEEEVFVSREKAQAFKAWIDV
ncbi:LytR/AlgR family response regulator transcription factor [Crocinitomix catalasitica]|uniref:LytR/AlgR family response regulator transcription factor n=1 Tax=Crocinitomix catalasitica TaxID=184607 RepID=UPI0006866CFE|nr:LytTR family DNA-binding domain-containing protein [Crocinitomix catalasitica]